MAQDIIANTLSVDNIEAKDLKINNYTILDANGKIPAERLNTPRLLQSDNNETITTDEVKVGDTIVSTESSKTVMKFMIQGERWGSGAGYGLYYGVVTAVTDTLITVRGFYLSNGVLTYGYVVYAKGY